MVRVFANGPEDLGSIPGRVIPKTQKMVLDASLTLSIIRYGSRVKWGNPGKGVAPFPIPWCCSYGKGSLRVTLDYGRQLYLLIYIYIKLHVVQLLKHETHGCIHYHVNSHIRVSSRPIGCPVYMALCHICSLMKAISWKHTHM